VAEKIAADDWTFENPPLKFRFKCSNDGDKCWLNGKLCHLITSEEHYKAQEEYEKVHPEGDSAA
jgi:hypothetical protein